MNRVLGPYLLLFFFLVSLCLAGEPGQERLPQRLAMFDYNETEVQAFLNIIQSNVQTDNAEVLADFVDYPFLFSSKTKAKDKKAFIADYKDFLDPRWKRAVLGQRYADLFVNWKGIMVHRGEIWFGRVCKNKDCSEQEIRIIAFNPWF